MDDSGRETNGTQDAEPEADIAGRDAADDRPRPHGPGRYARPALVAGLVTAVVCAALLVIIFFLDSFNATVYSVGGKDVQAATDEARSIRESYAAARIGGITFLVIGLALAAAGGFLLYRDRSAPGRNDAGDDGEDVDFEDLGGQ
ncbi:MAG: hypothetical protein JWM01_2724 [Arthrobacter sp.]|nr:hypothetical protein [Arthrobacter sp.]